MKIEIERLHVKDNPYNKVTEDLPYKKRRIRDRDGNLRFNENGIFCKIKSTSLNTGDLY